MKKIISIIAVEEKKTPNGSKYWRTHAMLEDGTECIGFGKDFKEDDEVEVFFHWETVKMRKRPDYELKGDYRE